MKIICLEEHTLDPPLSSAAHPAMEEHFPYMSASGSRY